MRKAVSDTTITLNQLLFPSHYESETYFGCLILPKIPRVAYVLRAHDHNYVQQPSQMPYLHFTAKASLDRLHME